MSDVKTEVEAALLNSEREPQAEVQAALEAVARFARLECQVGEGVFLQMAAQAWAVRTEAEVLEANSRALALKLINQCLRDEDQKDRGDLK